MRVLHGAIQIKPSLLKGEGSVVSIGNFDGVHLGHRALLTELVHQAKVQQKQSVVVTFSPHPMQVLRPDLPFVRLFDFADQVDQMAQLSVDMIVLEPFSREFSGLSAKDFFEQWLLRHLDPRAIVVGYDFAFGAQKEGSIEVLRALCKLHKIDFQVVQAKTVDSQIVSSSLIRKQLEQGNVQLVSKLLGRQFYLQGLVVKGDGRGRTLGYPTANMFIQDQQAIPGRGVYLTQSKLRGQSWMSVTNVGLNPTFAHQGVVLRVETHIPDFSSDLYGEVLQVSFVKKLRDEQKFAGASALVEQIKLDIEQARKLYRESL